MAGWLSELRKNTNEDFIIHVVGTKSDLVAEDPSRRRVPFERTIAYVAEALYPTQASTPPPTATGGMGFGSGVFGGSGGNVSNASASVAALQSPDSKRSSAFWGQEIGWDCCHEISARDGEGIEEVFRVITRKLVEQRNRRDGELVFSAAGTPIVNGTIGPFSPGFAEGTGSFRLGNDKRRSWLGLASPNVGNAEEIEVARAAKSKGRCC
jgi:hypothetical protein